MGKKYFVLDTNIIASNPHSIFSFDDNYVIIPDVVLKELESFKKEQSERGLHARSIARLLDELRSNGKLSDGVELPNGGTLKIELFNEEMKLPDGWQVNNDAKIIAVAWSLQNSGKDVHFVSKDIFARIRADEIGLEKVEDYFNDRVESTNSDDYSGKSEIYTTSENMKILNDTGILPVSEVKKINEKTGRMIKRFKLETNEFLLIRDFDDPQRHTMLARFDGDNIVPTVNIKRQPYGVIARSLGQKFMQEAMMAPAEEIPLVIIKGPAGTAKTFFSLACGLAHVTKPARGEGKRYRKILLARPTKTLDEDLGFLPGSEQSKIAPFMRSAMDNLEQLVDQDQNERYTNEKELKDKVDELFDRGIISTEAIAFMRGRSIVKQWFIIDEAQNLTPKQAKSIITRAGEGTKVILIGDPNQIDHPFLDSKNNGLVYAADKMRGSKLCAQLTLDAEDCERSPLAMESAQRL